jgi:hypothetical protein
MFFFLQHVWTPVTQVFSKSASSWLRHFFCDIQAPHATNTPRWSFFASRCHCVSETHGHLVTRLNNWLVSCHPWRKPVSNNLWEENHRKSTKTSIEVIAGSSFMTTQVSHIHQFLLKLYILYLQIKQPRGLLIQGRHCRRFANWAARQKLSRSPGLDLSSPPKRDGRCHSFDHRSNDT